MRIISDRHDYYDSVQKSQFDTNGAIWLRQNRYASKEDAARVIKMLGIENDIDYREFTPRSSIVIKHSAYNHNRGFNHSCLACLVCIAGRVYPMLEVTFRHLVKEEWVSYSKNFFDFDEYTQYNEITSNYFYRSQRYPQWFLSTKHTVKTDEPWSLLKTPVFIIRPFDGNWRSKLFSIECNPILKDLNFVKVLEPYTIWQEIDMFLQNQLVRELDPSVVPAEYRYTQRGFDEKWSFRTRPKKKT